MPTYLKERDKMLLKVQEYLQTKSLSDLQDELGILCNVYSDRVVLNYHQLDSPKFHPIVKECRGLILSLPKYEILNKTFNRFYNLNEDPNGKSFDFKNSYLFEKLDGTLISVYHDGQKWCVATRNTAFAEGSCNHDTDQTFYELFCKCVSSTFFDDLNKFVSKKHCISFELTSPENKVVKTYSDYQVTPLLIACKETLKEIYDPESLRQLSEKLQCRKPNVLFSHIDNNERSGAEIMDSLYKLNTTDEGYVLTSHASNWRVKIKNPRYLAIAHMRNDGEISIKRICYLVCTNDHVEYLNYFPEDKVHFEKYIEAFHQARMEIKSNRHMLEIENQKEFALAINHLRCKHVLFWMRKNKTSKIGPFFHDWKRLESYEDFLNKYVE